MAGWIDNDKVNKNIEDQTSIPRNAKSFAPKRVSSGVRDFERRDEQDADDSFELGRAENGKENEFPIRRKKSLPPPSAPPTGNAPAVPSEMLQKARDKAIRTSREGLSGLKKANNSIIDESQLETRTKEKSELDDYTDDDIDELLREEADIITRPSVNMSKFRANNNSDDEEEEDSTEETAEKILGEMEESLKRMPNKESPPKMDSRLSWALVAHESGGDTVRVHCTLLRDRFSSRMYPEYQLILDKNKMPILLGRKQSMNTTSNYHVFDLTRGALDVENQKYNKKSGNYLGKLRASNMDSTDYVLVTKATGREEVLAVSYERPSMMSTIVDGSQPRKLSVVLPHLDADSVPVPHIVTAGKGSIAGNVSMAEYLTDPVEAQARQFYSLSSKEPVYEKGNYRLNFYGRVSKPSVKNFQLVNIDDPDDIICQFGKVGEDKFHLDFKAPMSAFQAFGIALTQFNI